MANIEQVRDRLFSLGEPDFQKFSAALIPGEKRMIGVRLPHLRRLAREIAASGQWEEYLHAAPQQYFEEIMLRGMIIGAARIPLEERLCYMRSFIPEIDNWSICDSFCSSLKFAQKNRERVFQFVQPYCESRKEFEARFGFVMLLDFFLIEQYLPSVLAQVHAFHPAGYYSQMAVAWLLATALAKFPQPSLHCLCSAPLDDFTYLCTIKKALESRRVSEQTKAALQQLRKNPGQRTPEKAQ